MKKKKKKRSSAAGNLVLLSLFRYLTIPESTPIIISIRCYYYYRYYRVPFQITITRRPPSGFYCCRYIIDIRFFSKYSMDRRPTRANSRFCRKNLKKPCKLFFFFLFFFRFRRNNNPVVFNIGTRPDYIYKTVTMILITRR